MALAATVKAVLPPVPKVAVTSPVNVCPERMMVPEALGNVMVLSAVGLTTSIKVSKELAVAPSKMMPVVAKAALLAAKAGSEAKVAVLSRVSVGLPETPLPLVTVISRELPVSVLPVNVSAAV